MFNFLPKFGSCYRLPQRRRPATSDDDSFFCHVGTSGDDCHQVRNNRTYCRRNRPSAWRPTLSVIMEDNVYEDHDINVSRKSDKSGKNKSVTNVGCIINRRHRDNKERRPKPKIYVSPFAATPYMF
ncbi:hypothetical protein QN277_008395 [Acacia crassicarpa]|uniref:Uncharacterized protein n=1 Tax=Acacia crassicarpa TaxID=499986 RepID=A0AAE1IT12_9FABA|nr:hypothetical protein QN277_008395 [Acacia crassicarpa]